MTDTDTADADPLAGVPDWDDEYLDRVSDRLMHNYDLRKDEDVQGERFDLAGALHVENRKQLIHPSIRYAEHDAREYVFARRTDAVSVESVDALSELGEALADEWIDADEEHYETGFTFVVVAPEIPGDVRAFVRSHGGRTLLKYGYYGRYEVNLVVVAPDREDVVASEHADVASAFTLWDVDETEESAVRRLIQLFRG
ncbi:hypothetical protein [Salarchaeum sp. JOR-1]|uniref:hypothetical protein n=1 Tax=Salarchaeum sp. JOR-1 TaxID=2599399 RepID=UPI0011986C60|nr:hypothetical protein [Salarchaeum sp. JOR-1]QDX40307.1 hypothetical protein FQU85_05125 [Salarchaeum sp. JOR-1]